MIRRDSLTGLGNGTVGYVRRSTDEQEQSIEDQKNAISAYIAENGLRFLRFYVDDAISGTSTLGRRAFRQMIRDAESSPRLFDIIAVYDIKRFGRIDNDEAGYYRYLLRTHGIEVRYVSENFNGDTTDDLLRPVNLLLGPLKTGTDREMPPPQKSTIGNVRILSFSLVNHFVHL